MIYVDDELQGLEHSRHVLELLSKDTSAEVRVRPDWVPIRVEGAEQSPEEQAGITRNTTHFGVRQQTFLYTRMR